LSYSYHQSTHIITAIDPDIMMLSRLHASSQQVLVTACMTLLQVGYDVAVQYTCRLSANLYTLSYVVHFDRMHLLQVGYNVAVQ
jgi:hypothetical protein